MLTHFGVGRLEKEATLRACRPAHLPSEAPDSFQPLPTSISPPRELPEVVRTMVQGLMQENALWSEREAFASAQGGWNQAPPCGFQQSWLCGMLGEGPGQGRGLWDRLVMS